MSLGHPSDFEPHDIAYAEAIVPDGSFVEQMVTVVCWLNTDGVRRWKCYNATSEGISSSATVGLLEFAKLDIIARSDTGLPFSYET